MGRHCLLASCCCLTLLWILATVALVDEQLLWSTKLETLIALVVLFEPLQSVSSPLIPTAYLSLASISLIASLSLTAKTAIPAKSNEP